MTAPEADGLPIPQRYWAMLVIALTIMMAVLDGSIANVALPTIAKDMHATPADSIWVVNAYQLVITILMLPLASLGEIVGYRRVYRAGIVLFTLASLGCALSDSILTLSAARVVQGIGAAGVMSVNAALVRFIYPSRLLGRGIGIIALVVAVSAAAGPTIAAAILSVASWPWLFAVNVPIGIATLALAHMLPRTPRSGRRFDVPSALLNALFFGLLIIGIDSIGHGGRPLYAVLAFLGALGLVTFAAGLTLLALLPATAGDADIVWRMALCGAGFGLFQSPNNRVIMTSAPRERSGGASGMLGTARLLGQTVGAALVALMFSLFGVRANVWALGLATAIALLAAAVSSSRLVKRSPGKP